MLKLIRAPHKYVQGKDALYTFYENVKDLGNRILFISSNSGLKYCKDKLETSFGDSECFRRYEKFGGISSVSEIEKMRKMIKEDNINLVVGMGGGSAIDTAKAAAYYEKLPVVIVPTIAATDAPCTGLSVIYNDDGTFNAYIFYPQNPDVVLVDTTIIANSPVKYIRAGMGDALGTYFEARMCQRVDAPSLENGGISSSALALCKLCYERLLEHGQKAVWSVENHLVNESVDEIVEATIYLSGVGADNGGLCIAHSIYNGFTSISTNTAMHGELVAFGTLIQLLFEDAPKEEIKEVMDFMYSVSLPLTLVEMGIKEGDELRRACELSLKEGETIHYFPRDIDADTLYDFVLTADLLGRKYFQEKNK